MNDSAEIPILAKSKSLRHKVTVNFLLQTNQLLISKYRKYKAYLMEKDGE